MALAAVAAGADGLMVEVHPDPRNAAVDPLQPLDYVRFAALVRDVEATRVATRAATRP
jgi:3-deoxy-7-phosphoheptulonate synthase